MTARFLRAVSALAALLVFAPAVRAGVDRWSEAGPGTPAGPLAMVASDPYRLFVAVGCEVFASTDGGERWQSRGPVPGCTGELSLLAAPTPGTLYAGSGVGTPALLRSVDEGRSWRPLLPEFVVSLLVHPGDPNLVLAGGSGILRSADGGESWERVLQGRVTQGPFSTSYHASSLYLDPVDPSLIRANVQEITPGSFSEGCYESRDGGMSWSEPPGSCFEAPVEWLPGLRLRPGECEVHWPFSIVCDAGDFEPTAEVPSIPGDTLILVPAPAPVLYAADHETSAVHRSLDGGGSWQPVDGWDTLLPPGPSSPRDMPRTFVHPDVPARVYRLAGPVYRATFVGAEPLLLHGGRIETRAAWRAPAGQAAAAQPILLEGGSGAFWFRRPDNLEIGVKVVDGRAVNQRFWAFQTALSNLEREVTVTDLVTGRSRSWLDAAGRFAAHADTATLFDPPAPGAVGAVAGPPEPPADPPSSGRVLAAGTAPAVAAAAPGTAGCATAGETLCLLGRFEVEASWRDGGELRPALAAPIGGAAGAFRFHPGSSLQLLIKALDGRPVNGRFWIFYGGLTGRELTFTVTDTETGSSRTFETRAGEPESGADTETFLAP